MLIKRNIISYLLNTSPENIKTISRERDQIKVVLYDSKEIQTISKERYRRIKIKIENYKKKKNFDSSLNNITKKNIGVGLILIGIITAFTGLSLDTTVNTEFGRVHNTGKQQEQTLITMLGGMSFLGGIILFAIDNSENNKKKD